MKKISTALLLFTIIIISQSTSVNPPSSVAGQVARGEVGGLHCLSCHHDGIIAPPAPTGGLSLVSSGGNHYNHNDIYNLTFSIDSANVLHGFQMVALDSNKNTVGHFMSNDSNIAINQVFMFNQGDTIEHIEHRNLPATNSNVFLFDWQAPSNYSGPITFYALGVAADGDGLSDGILSGGQDRAYYQHFTIQYATNTSAKVLESQLIKRAKVFPNYIMSNSNNSIQFEIESKEAIALNLALIDVSGRFVQHFASQVIAEGENRLTLSLKALEPGIYFVINRGNGSVKIKEEIIVY